MKRPVSGAAWRADLALVLITLIWGATFVVVKRALEEVSTLLFLSLRFSLAAVALGVAFRGRLSGQRRGLWAGMIAGACLFAGYFFQTLGLNYTTPSKSAFLTGLSVVLVPLLGACVYRSVPGVSEWLGVGVATAGMALMTLEGPSLAISRGDLLTLACAAGFAIHILVVGHYSRATGFEALSLTQIATAAAIALGTFWWAETPRIRWSGPVAMAVAVTGLLATAVAFSIQAWAQQRTSATRTALIFALEPVFAALTSFVVAGEVLSGRAAAGAAMILAGIVLVELKPMEGAGHPSWWSRPSLL